MAEYDFIFAGGGAAGLGLAYQISQSSLRHSKMLIIDKDKKERNDRTWCFWSAQSFPYDHTVYRQWDQITFISDTFKSRYDLAPYRYKMVRGIDFYRSMHATLKAEPNIDFVQAPVENIEDCPDCALVHTGQGVFSGRWVFNSTFKPSDYTSGPPGYHYLIQHFRGWEIETDTDAFDPDTVTLFDFRTPQKGSMRFVYILPFTRRSALVEYTLFSPKVLKPPEYEKALSDYIADVLKLPEYRVTNVENGIIPMTDRPFNRRTGQHVMAIGTKGGLVKPSSGYAFLRMQKDAAAIVNSLRTHGHPFDVPRSPWRYRLFDSIMLQVMYRQGHLMDRIFTSLFKNNSIHRIFRFLDETAPFPENLRLLASLPPTPFIKALIRLKLLRKV